MDERKTVIKNWEEKQRADVESRRLLLAGLGERLILRIENAGTFTADTGGILEEYRARLNEIAASNDSIANLEAVILRLKEMEDTISVKETEASRLSKEIEEAFEHLGRVLLTRQGFDDFAGSYRLQEEALLAKVDEQEQKLLSLEERGGNLFTWLGKNAQMAVAKALILKNQSALQRLYQSAGEHFFDVKSAETLDGELAGAALAAEGLKSGWAKIADELSGLIEERRQMKDSFGADGSPSRRIQGFQKRIAVIKSELPALYFRFGFWAAKTAAADALAPFMQDEDRLTLEKAAEYETLIADSEKKIEKIKAVISIDQEKAEIERIKKAIAQQRQKINTASVEISDLEKQIDGAEANITKLEAFLKENSTEQSWQAE